MDEDLKKLLDPAWAVVVKKRRSRLLLASALGIGAGAALWLLLDKDSDGATFVACGMVAAVVTFLTFALPDYFSAPEWSLASDELLAGIAALEFVDQEALVAFKEQLQKHGRVSVDHVQTLFFTESQARWKAESLKKPGALKLLQVKGEACCN